ncbi:MAG: phosphopantothenoylcysteine decarboxylase [Parcubacteria group bacterium]|nr:MAG: phosphopantothenoylcysteine decarboxylase [Parcubacteria group bacterium]
MSKLQGKKILVGISGGIAAYKIATLINQLLKNGAEVRVIMTEAATKFVTPITFQALTNRAVYTDMFSSINAEEVEHISLAKWCDIFVLAPATANTIGKLANGIADNMLTTVIMALPQNKKVVIAPAMNTEMWLNRITQDNVDYLKKIDNKYIFEDPQPGLLACRDEGIGKVAETENIIKTIEKNI